jgi:hypothetical protein
VDKYSHGYIRDNNPFRNLTKLMDSSPPPVTCIYVTLVNISLYSTYRMVVKKMPEEE